MQKLLNNENTTQKSKPDIDKLAKELPILKSETEKATNPLKNNKAAGGDGITDDRIKAKGEHDTNIIHGLCKLMWETGEWPKE